MRIKEGNLLLIFVIGLIVGCGPSIQSVGTVEKVQGKVIGGDGAPIGNVLVILQPTENGYVTEMEADAKGAFEGELIPGKYVYYFAPSKKSKAAMPKTISAPFTEPKMEHMVEVKAGAEIVCKAE